MVYEGQDLFIKEAELGNVRCSCTHSIYAHGIIKENGVDRIGNCLQITGTGEKTIDVLHENGGQWIYSKELVTVIESTCPCQEFKNNK